MSNNSLNPRLPAAAAALTAIVLLAGPSARAQPAQGDDELALFTTQQVLGREALLRLVLERNPTLAAAGHGLRAAQALIRQETALEDPRLSYSFAPLSVAGPVRFGQVIELSQSIPFPGKLGLKGEVAQAEAAASAEDLSEARLRLELLASMLFDDLFVAQRALAITVEQIGSFEQLKKSAEAQYVVGRAAQQDSLQAEVELSHILHDKMVLESESDRIRAQLNGLLHRRPDERLPPAPLELALPAPLETSSAELQEQALSARPELAAVRARIGGGEAAVGLARRGYLPDFTVMASYNSMWMDTAHQFMAGVAINLPIQLGSRSAALDGAQARLVGLRSEEQRLVIQIRVDVDVARTRALEAHHILHLYNTRLIPAARDQVAAARAGFESGKSSFTALVEAQKNLRTIDLRTQMAVADVQRRRAELHRALGRSLLPSAAGESVR